jgi:hypothetical protein
MLLPSVKRKKQPYQLKRMQVKRCFQCVDAVHPAPLTWLPWSAISESISAPMYAESVPAVSSDVVQLCVCFSPLSKTNQQLARQWDGRLGAPPRAMTTPGNVNVIVQLIGWPLCACGARAAFLAL